MAVTMPKLALIVAAALCLCTSSPQAAAAEPETVLTSPMDPTVDADLCFGKAQPDGMAVPIALIRWAEK